MISGQIILITLIGNKPLFFSPADAADLRRGFLKPWITLNANKLQVFLPLITLTYAEVF